MHSFTALCFSSGQAQTEVIAGVTVIGVTVLLLSIVIILTISVTVLVRNRKKTKPDAIYDDIVYYTDANKRGSTHSNDIDHPYNVIGSGSAATYPTQDVSGPGQYERARDMVEAGQYERAPAIDVTQILREVIIDNIRKDLECFEQVKVYGPSNSIYEQISGYEQVPNPDMEQILSNLTDETYETISGYEHVPYNPMIQEMLQNMQTGVANVLPLYRQGAQYTDTGDVGDTGDTEQCYERFQYREEINKMFEILASTSSGHETTQL